MVFVVINPLKIIPKRLIITITELTNLYILSTFSFLVVIYEYTLTINAPLIMVIKRSNI